MLKRILLVWFVANFVLAGVYALLSGGWYLRLPTVTRMVAELCLIILPNLVFPVLILRYAWPFPVGRLRLELGWQWNGGRSIMIGLAAFALYLVLSSLIGRVLGPSIPYNLPGEGGGVGGLIGLLLLVFFVIFVVLTVTGEETMFRGFIQTQVGQRDGVWLGILLTVVLFGIRHLPADIFYGHIWQATPQMWLSRQVDLYLGATILGLARYFGRSTYASATMHLLLFLFTLIAGFFQ